MVASGGASEGRGAAAAGASCRGGPLHQGGPGQAPQSAGALLVAEGSGHAAAAAAAAPFAVELVAQHISTVPCGSSDAQ